MEWTRDAKTWKYHATDDAGSHWHLIQASSRKWEVYRDGVLFADWPNTLAEAKWAAEEEADPARKARAIERKRLREERRRKT